MEIRDQMTATVRLTKQAALRLRTFIGSLNTPPKNMNDALNLALSDLPLSSFIDEVSTLQQDERQALLDINERFRSSGLLKRSDYYFMVLMARRATMLTHKERVHHQSIQTTLEMTLALWDLCKNRDTEGHHERYMLGNIGGGRDGEESRHLVTYIPIYVEETKTHPYPGTLDFALRNPEVMLRNDVSHVDDMIINEKLRPYFGVLYSMAVRCLYLKTGEPLSSSEGQKYFSQTFSGSFGKRNIVHAIQSSSKNFSFSISFIEKERSLNIAANTIIEAEEFFTAFSDRRDQEKSYKGENFTLMQTQEDGALQGGFIFQTRNVQTNISRQEYDNACEAITEMLANPAVQNALKEARDCYGTI